MKRFPRPHKTDSRQIIVGLALLLACGLLSVIVFPSLDYRLGNVRPGLLSVVGPAASISLVTIGLLFWLAEGKASYTKRLVVFLSTFAALMAFVKFTLSPAVLFVAESSFHLSNDYANMWSTPGMVLACIILGIFLMYMAVFALLRQIFSKKLGIRSEGQKAPARSSYSKTRDRLVVLFALGGLVVLTGGAVVAIPLLMLFMMVGSVEPLLQYLGFVFSGAVGVMLAVSLASGAGFLSWAFDEAVNTSRLRRDIAVFVSVVWITLGLLVVYHVLWAVYLFVLVTFWPFKVTNVVPK